MNRALASTAWWLVALSAWLSGQGPAALVDDDGLDPARRCAALGELFDRGQLTVAQLGAALDGSNEPLRATAVAIARHEWCEWPTALLDFLEAHPVAARAVLHELAIAPRPSVDGWVARQAATALASDLRLLALAARQAAPERNEGERILRGLVSEDAAAAALAIGRLPAAVADQLVGVAHGLLAGGAPPELLTPFFDRLSDGGSRQLLGLVATLGPALAGPLGAELARRDVPQFWVRVRAAVDGEIALEPPWLRWSGRVLDTAARRGRVARILADGGELMARRIEAFDALLDGKVFVPAMTAFLAEGDADRWRRLFAAGLTGVPQALALSALDGPDAVRNEALRALSRRPLAPAEEARIVELAQAGMGRDGIDERGLALVLATLAQAGSDRGAALALDCARGDADWFADVCEQLGRRRDPIGSSALLAELQRPPAAGEPVEHVMRRRDLLALVLAEAHDRRQVEVLLTGLPARRAGFVRRCRRALPDLAAAQWRELAAALPGIADHDVRVEVLAWIGASTEPAVRDRLRASCQTADDEEEREVALQGLLAGPERGDLLAAWRAASARDPDTDDRYSFAAIATMPEQLGDADLELLQYLLFTAPRLDPRESERSRQFREGRAGFPVVAAIADRLRRDPTAAARVCRDAAALAAAGDTKGLVRQRFLFLWTALQASPGLRFEVATATAALVLAIPDPEQVGDGPAQYYLTAALTAAGRHAEALTAARAAIAGLLRSPAAAMDARIHLGVRDGDAGTDPYAALATAPWLALARAALARQDPAAARTALTQALEFAGRDSATLAAIRATLGACK